MGGQRHGAVEGAHLRAHYIIIILYCFIKRLYSVVDMGAYSLSRVPAFIGNQ